MRLFGREYSRRELAERSGALSQYFGVRQMELAEGVERGVRMLEFRTGTGLRFTVLVDRALDIADFEYQGRPIGWHSPTGFRHPGLHEYEGEGGLGWMRSFSGMLVTCGLDHFGLADDGPADHFGYALRKSVPNTMHGRIGTTPGQLTGYGERWEGDRCYLWCEGLVRQAAVFGENLHLTRRIEVEVGTDDVRIRDDVVNQGFRPTPHMLCYHFNVGHPVVDADARFLAPISEVLWAAYDGDETRKQGAGYRTLAAPQEGFCDQAWEHQLVVAEDGTVPIALVNERAGLGIEIVIRQNQLPCLYEWQDLQPGQYLVGIEPATHHIVGAEAARQRNEVIWLQHGEARQYELVLKVLPGAEAIAACERRIRGIGSQPEEGFPSPSNRFPSLRARAPGGVHRP